MIRAASVAITKSAVNQSLRKGTTICQQRNITDSLSCSISLNTDIITKNSFGRKFNENANISVVRFNNKIVRNHSTSAREAIRKARYGKGNSNEGENVLSLPSNLKIDLSSTVSPVFGLNKVSPNNLEDHAEEEDDILKEETKEDGANETNEEDYADDVEGEDEEYEEDELLYSLENTPLTEPNYVVPLPERLHVPIFSLYPDKSIVKDDEESTDFELTPTEVGTIHLPPYLFGQDPIRIDILHRVVVYQRNKKRGKRFAALSKTISTKSGSGKKMRPQKGSGRARAGHKRAAHWRGGAKAHGPKGVVQDYTTKLNKKVRKMGLRHALSQKLKEGNLVLVNELRGESVKTKDLAATLELFYIGGKGIEGATALILDEPEDDEESVGGVNAVLRLASRNLHKIKMLNQLQANVYDILKYDKLMMSLSALQALEKRLGE